MQQLRDIEKRLSSQHPIVQSSGCARLFSLLNLDNPAPTDDRVLDQSIEAYKMVSKLLVRTDSLNIHSLVVISRHFRNNWKGLLSIVGLEELKILVERWISSCPIHQVIPNVIALALFVYEYSGDRMGLLIIFKRNQFCWKYLTVLSRGGIEGVESILEMLMAASLICDPLNPSSIRFETSSVDALRVVERVGACSLDMEDLLLILGRVDCTACPLSRLLGLYRDRSLVGDQCLILPFVLDCMSANTLLVADVVNLFDTLALALSQEPCISPMSDRISTLLVRLVDSDVDVPSFALGFLFFSLLSFSLLPGYKDSSSEGLFMLVNQRIRTAETNDGFTDRQCPLSLGHHINWKVSRFIVSNSEGEKIRVIDDLSQEIPIESGMVFLAFVNWVLKTEQSAPVAKHVILDLLPSYYGICRRDSFISGKIIKLLEGMCDSPLHLISACALRAIGRCYKHDVRLWTTAFSRVSRFIVDASKIKRNDHADKVNPRHIAALSVARDWCKDCDDNIVGQFLPLLASVLSSSSEDSHPVLLYYLLQCVNLLLASDAVSPLALWSTFMQRFLNSYKLSSQTGDQVDVWSEITTFYGLLGSFSQPSESVDELKLDCLQTKLLPLAGVHFDGRRWSHETQFGRIRAMALESIGEFSFEFVSKSILDAKSFCEHVLRSDDYSNHMKASIISSFCKTEISSMRPSVFKGDSVGKTRSRDEESKSAFSKSIDQLRSDLIQRLVKLWVSPSLVSASLRNSISYFTLCNATDFVLEMEKHSDVDLWDLFTQLLSAGLSDVPSEQSSVQIAWKNLYLAFVPKLLSGSVLGASVSEKDVFEQLASDLLKTRMDTATPIGTKCNLIKAALGLAAAVSSLGLISNSYIVGFLGNCIMDIVIENSSNKGVTSSTELVQTGIVCLTELITSNSSVDPLLLKRLDSHVKQIHDSRNTYFVVEGLRWAVGFYAASTLELPVEQWRDSLTSEIHDMLLTPLNSVQRIDMQVDEHVLYGFLDAIEQAYLGGASLDSYKDAATLLLAGAGDRIYQNKITDIEVKLLKFAFVIADDVPEISLDQLPHSLKSAYCKSTSAKLSRIPLSDPGYYPRVKDFFLSLAPLQRNDKVEVVAPLLERGAITTDEPSSQTTQLFFQILHTVLEPIGVSRRAVESFGTAVPEVSTARSAIVSLAGILHDKRRVVHYKASVDTVGFAEEPSDLSRLPRSSSFVRAVFETAVNPLDPQWRCAVLTLEKIGVDLPAASWGKVISDISKYSRDVFGDDLDNVLSLIFYLASQSKSTCEAVWSRSCGSLRRDAALLCPAQYIIALNNAAESGKVSEQEVAELMKVLRGEDGSLDVPILRHLKEHAKSETVKRCIFEILRDHRRSNSKLVAELLHYTSPNSIALVGRVPESYDARNLAISTPEALHMMHVAAIVDDFPVERTFAYVLYHLILLEGSRILLPAWTNSLRALRSRQRKVLEPCLLHLLDICIIFTREKPERKQLLEPSLAAVLAVGLEHVPHYHEPSFTDCLSLLKRRILEKDLESFEIEVRFNPQWEY